MDRGNKKRATESDEKASSKRRGKKKIEAVHVDPFLIDESDIFKIASSETATGASNHYQHRPLSIFEFPWQKENLVSAEADHGCDLRDVFFSSLVDGCKAVIGFPGDRLSPSPASISLPDETDGVDCIWSCALREPLSLRCVQ